VSRASGLCCYPYRHAQYCMSVRLTAKYWRTKSPTEGHACGHASYSPHVGYSLPLYESRTQTSESNCRNTIEEPDVYITYHCKMKQNKIKITQNLTLRSNPDGRLFRQQPRANSLLHPQRPQCGPGLCPSASSLSGSHTPQHLMGRRMCGHRKGSQGRSSQIALGSIRAVSGCPINSPNTSNCNFRESTLASLPIHPDPDVVHRCDILHAS